MGHEHNTFTKRLLHLQEKKGAVIKCARKEFEGQEMVYRPRWDSSKAITGDPMGWVLKTDPDGRRFSGGDCYASW